MGSAGNNPVNINPQATAEVQVGKRLRQLRARQGYSLRALADHSGLNVNTLSLVENGRSSPSVSTLQQLALALKVPIAAFFETEPHEKQVVFTPAGNRPQASFGRTQMQNLGKDLSGNVVQPFLVTLNPGSGSGDQLIVHTGHEFVFCLAGSLRYQVDGSIYNLGPGDSLVFEAHLPHCWENNGENIAQILLTIIPSDQRDTPGGRHFTIETIKQEINMKIAVITEDEKTVSRHFGRAPYYLVITIEEGKIIHREVREKVGHSHFHHQGEESHGRHHGFDDASHQRHISMAETIADCKVLICGGMGAGAYESMQRLNIQPVITDLSDIDSAVQALIEGKLIDHTELLH